MNLHDSGIVRIRKRFSRSCKGAAMIGMAIILGLVSVVAIASVSVVGDKTRIVFCNAAEAIAGEDGIYGCPDILADGSRTGVGEDSSEDDVPPHPAGQMVLTFKNYAVASQIYMTKNKGQELFMVSWDGTRIDCEASVTSCSFSVGYDPNGSNQDSIKVSFEGSAKSFKISSGADRLLSVDSFGNLGLVDLSNAFEDADSLESLGPLPSTVTDVREIFKNADGDLHGVAAWNMSNVRYADGMFYNASSFNEDISGWDISRIFNMKNMFRGASSFSADISNWDVSEVKYMDAMFRDAPSFSANLISWCPKYISSEPRYFAYRSGVVQKPIWGDCVVPDFDQALKIEIVPGASYLHLYLDGDRIRYMKPDGTIETKADGTSASIMLDVRGAASSENVGPNGGKVVSILGYPLRHFKVEPFSSNIVMSIVSFGNVGLESLEDAFKGIGSQFSHVAPIPETVTDISGIFEGSGADPVGIESWNTANVVDMSRAFYGATRFARDLSGWNVSNVVDMRWMFYNSNPGSGIGSWDVSKVEDMSGMFSGSSISDDIGAWDVSSVRNMEGMFSHANRFNADITSWDVSNVANMDSMFFGAVNFNQDLSSWCPNISVAPYKFGSDEFQHPFWGTCQPPDFSNAVKLTFGDIYQEVKFELTGAKTYIKWPNGIIQQLSSDSRIVSNTVMKTFQSRSATPLNVEMIGYPLKHFKISSLDYRYRAAVASVDSFGNVGLESLKESFAVIHGPNFVANIPSTVKDIQSVFFGSSGHFVGVENWDVSNVTNMRHAFASSNFDRDISSWDVRNVSDMYGMFSNNNKFSHDLSGWCVSRITSEPRDFGGTNFVHPNWGTCPN